MPHTPEPDWRRHGDTLGALLAHRATHDADKPYLHLIDDAQRETTTPFGEMGRLADAVAAGLVAKGVKKGDRVLVVLPTGLEFVSLFFALQRLGAVAVPAYPPLRAKGIEDYQARLAALMRVATPSLVVTFARVRLVVEAAAYQSGVAAAVIEPAALAGHSGFVPPAVTSGDPALVQFSSGSTGAPKGVTLSHANVLANLASVLEVIQPGPDDVNCSWLPLYHDMGLIGGLLMPLYCGNPLVLLSPQSFLLDPKRWLWAIHRHKATISTAPNFAYQLVASRLDDAELEGLDLSSWRLALNGAEPVVAATMDAFATRLAPYGFDPRALTPVYGMAEAALGAVFPTLGRGPRLDVVSPESLAASGVATPAAEGRVIASVGQALPGFAVRVVDEAGADAPERAVGEIQLQGPSVMAGYLNAPDATATAFSDGWLRTGDLGYMADGELYVVGRSKDLIVKGGRNYAPQDLEAAAEQVAGIRKGCVAAFGVDDPATGTEAVVLVCETKAPADTHAELAKAVSKRVADAVGLSPDHVTLVGPHTVPKTSSGKLQRSRCKALWLSESLQPLAEPGLLAKGRTFGQAIAHRLGAPRPHA
jgi:acyl-CoA synthetase (AMP-forming)/AMP-acid ligase II